MNIILFESDEIKADPVLINDRRAEHIAKILKAEVGDRLRVGEIGGRMGTGEIIHLKNKYPFEVSLHLELTDTPPETPLIDLILALPRPIMLKRIFSQATALGVGTIYLINGNRVEKSFWKANILNPEEFRLHLLQGLEQAVDTCLPKVSVHKRFRPFIEDHFPQIKGGYDTLVCAHPGGRRTLAKAVRSKKGRIALAIGPEGGWVEYEIEKFKQQGFACCSMGKRVLKVDTGVVALHAAITALRQPPSSNPVPDKEFSSS